MKPFRRSWIPVLFLLVPLTTLFSVRAADTPVVAPPESAPQPPPYSNVTYAQIVRLTYAAGDVRVERGATKDAGWEAAVSGLPLLSGFTLATGADGLAEIELEDTSTLYLDANSVLVLNVLETSAGIPYTGVSLLSGTVALHIRPDAPRDQFVLETPTDDVNVGYPLRADLRVTSYTNAIALTLLKSAEETLSTAPQPERAGETDYYSHGARLLSASSGAAAPPAVQAPAAPEDFTAFDRWVADRLAARQAAMGEAMKEFGLAEPIPGLDEMAGKGTFFACAPYGTCWTPPEMGAIAPPQMAASAGQAPVDIADAQAGQPASGDAGAAAPLPSASNPAAPQSTQVSQKPAQVQQTRTRNRPFESAADFFPCLPDSMLYALGMYPYAGLIPPDLQASGGSAYGYAPSAAPWQWAVCHAGAWLYRNHRYVWVAGHRRWHRTPIRWVRSGRTTGFVPLHPRDVEDKLPVNRSHGVYILNRKPAGTQEAQLERVALTPGAIPELLKEPPKEYRSDFLAPLPRTSDPLMVARSVSFGPHIAARVTNEAGLSFDRKSQSILMARQVTEAGRTRTVTEPLAKTWARGGDGSGGTRAFSGGSAGRPGGFSGAARGGGFSGGASHAGGGYSGGAPASSGSHAGGGGSSGGGGGSSSGHH